jgi:plasmid maintenance system antidote protein VapI
MDKARPTIIESALRSAISRSGLTHYKLGQLAGVAPSMIDRFVSGERDLRLSTAARIAEALGMELQAKK